MKRFLFLIFTSLLLCACSSYGKNARLHHALSEFVKDKDATIGIAVIIDGTDTVAVNGDRPFPMLSVYKFPIAVASGSYYMESGLSLNHPVTIQPGDLHADTYSPMTESLLASSRVMTDTIRMSAGELLAYMLQQSDNNASDIILRTIGGPAAVNMYLQGMGVTGIMITHSEAAMHTDPSLCYSNSATPLAMATFIDRFYRNSNDSISQAIKRLMETCQTGTDRLAKPLTNPAITLGHKTGTGFTLPDGRLMAVNDVGYVHLPDGHQYAIAVFIENSGYDMAHTEALIAGISRIVLTILTEK